MSKLIGYSLIILLLLNLISFTPSANEVNDFWSTYRIMRCNFHSHTKGSKTPNVDAQNIYDADHFFALAIEKMLELARRLGIHLGISDHDCKITLNEWYEQKLVIDRFCTDGYPTVRGFEWTGYNHINIFNSRDFVTVFDVGAEGIRECKDIDSLLDWLANEPDEVIAQFNHPTMSKHYFDFAKIAKHTAKDHFRLIEVGSGPTGFYSHIKDNLPQCILAWQNGLRLGVSDGIDNFGPPNQDMVKRHMALWVKDYSREGMIEAIRSCRTYASEDQDYLLKFYLKQVDENGTTHLTPMGSEAEITNPSVFNLGYDLADPTDNEIGQVNLVVVKRNSTQTITVNNNGRIIRTVAMSDFTADELEDIICFFLYIQQPDGDNIVSSPIWIKYSPQPVINQSERLIYCGVTSCLPQFKLFLTEPERFFPIESKEKFFGPQDKEFFVWLAIYGQPVNQSVTMKIRLSCPDTGFDKPYERTYLNEKDGFCLIFGVFDIPQRPPNIRGVNHFAVEFYVDDELVDTKYIDVYVNLDYGQ